MELTLASPLRRIFFLKLRKPWVRSQRQANTVPTSHQSDSAETVIVHDYVPTYLIYGLLTWLTSRLLTTAEADWFDQVSCWLTVFGSPVARLPYGSNSASNVVCLQYLPIPPTQIPRARLFRSPIQLNPTSRRRSAACSHNKQASQPACPRIETMTVQLLQAN